MAGSDDRQRRDSAFRAAREVRATCESAKWVDTWNGSSTDTHPRWPAWPRLSVPRPPREHPHSRHRIAPDTPAGLDTRAGFPVSRLVVDPERFSDDHREPMAAKGMGVIYTRTSDGRPLRKALSDHERADLLATYYRPHHGALTADLESALAAKGRCLIVDCHSFSSRPLPHEPDQSPDRPEICIGTDEYHTPRWLSDMILSLFQGGG